MSYIINFLIGCLALSILGGFIYAIYYFQKTNSPVSILAFMVVTIIAYFLGAYLRKK